MTVDKQTPAAELQLVTSECAAALLDVPHTHLRYAAWPQVVKDGEQTELLTGEAWVYSPSGRLDDAAPHPSVVFHRGVVLGVVDDLDGVGGYFSTQHSEGKDFMQRRNKQTSANG